MSDETRCSFCETLPTMAPGSWGGRASKCPLCRQELWTGSDGSTYRLSDAPAPARSKRGWAIGAGLIAVAGLIAGCYVAFKPRDLENPTGPVTWIQARSEPVAKVDGPIVQAKWAWPAYDAQAKPLPKPVVKPPIAQTANRNLDRPTPVSKGSGGITRDPSRKWGGLISTEEALQAELRDVPQVDLDPDYLTKKKGQIAAAAKEIIEANGKDKDAFVRKLMKDREDLSGLPFLLGKDCATDANLASALAGNSRQIREALSEFARTTKAKIAEDKMDKAVNRFWSDASVSRSRQTTVRQTDVHFGNIGALHQILGPEKKDLRASFINRLHRYPGWENKPATDVLLNRALFDLDPDIRSQAVEFLRYQSHREYDNVLKKALRHPWRAVVRHAAQAIVALDLHEMAPHLVSLLDEPDPSAPFTVKGMDGKNKSMVHELVRINHHRNCMLCHAPVDASNRDEVRQIRDLPVGPTPIPQDTLPPISSEFYYSPREGVTLVRADITYLRQDFSLMQSVKNAGKWPEMQRFDFLVRTREAKPNDARIVPNEYRNLIAETLASLTSLSAEPTAQAWRKALTQLDTPAQAKVKPAR